MTRTCRKGIPMNRFFLTTSAALLFALAGDPPTASAQPQAPGGGISRPTFSPYLNLLGGGRSPAFNYLGIVRPQQELNQQLGQLQQQVTQQSQLINQANQANEASDESLLPPTGNVSVSNSTGGYFNRIPGISAGGGSSVVGFNRPLGAVGRAAAGSAFVPTPSVSAWGRIPSTSSAGGGRAGGGSGSGFGPAPFGPVPFGFGPTRPAGRR